ncbi:MAG: vitamin K epoxide reductase family protein [Acidimicrobiales bacterium]
MSSRRAVSVDREAPRPLAAGHATAAAPDARRTTSPPPVAVAPWLPPAATVVAVLGAAVAAYLTVAHFTTSAVLLCSGSGTIDCAKVTTSPESVIVGIPVAVLGLFYFLVMVGLNLPRSWRAEGRVGAWLARLRLVGVVVGIGFALYLVSAEVLVIGSICIYCTIAHILAFALFVLVAAGSAQRGLGAPA